METYVLTVTTKVEVLGKERTSTIGKELTANAKLQIVAGAIHDTVFLGLANGEGVVRLPMANPVDQI